MKRTFGWLAVIAVISFPAILPAADTSVRVVPSYISSGHNLWFAPSQSQWAKYEQEQLWYAEYTFQSDAYWQNSWSFPNWPMNNQTNLLFGWDEINWPASDWPVTVPGEGGWESGLPATSSAAIIAPTGSSIRFSMA